MRKKKQREGTNSKNMPPKYGRSRVRYNLTKRYHFEVFNPKKNNLNMDLGKPALLIKCRNPVNNEGFHKTDSASPPQNL